MADLANFLARRPPTERMPVLDASIPKFLNQKRLQIRLFLIKCNFCSLEANTIQCGNCKRHLPSCNIYTSAHETCMECDEPLCNDCKKALAPGTKCSSQSYCRSSASFLLCSESRSFCQICELCGDAIIRCYVCLHKGKRYTEEELKVRHNELYHSVK